MFCFFWNCIYSSRSIKQNQRQINYSNTPRVQNNESIMYGIYCIAFIEYMLSEKTLLDYTNLFSPIDSNKNDKIIYV